MHHGRTLAAWIGSDLGMVAFVSAGSRWSSRTGRCSGPVSAWPRWPDCDCSPAAHGLRGTLIGPIVGALDDIIAGAEMIWQISRPESRWTRLKERCQHIDPAIDPMPRFRGPVAVIAEVKRSSPSRRLTAEIADPAALVVGYGVQVVHPRFRY